MKYQHTKRPGFLLGCIDFCTFGLFFLLYMPLGGLQDELDEILGIKTQRYWVAYLLGIPTAFIYTLVWMSRIAEKLKTKAIELNIDGPYTSWWHMFRWNNLWPVAIRSRCGYLSVLRHAKQGRVRTEQKCF